MKYRMVDHPSSSVGAVAVNMKVSMKEGWKS